MVTKDLTKLRTEIDFLVGVKCPILSCHGGYNNLPKLDTCPTCNGTGLKREYDCLRLKCWQPCRQILHWTEFDYTGIHFDPVLPAERVHEVMTSLMIAVSKWQEVRTIDIMYSDSYSTPYSISIIRTAQYMPINKDGDSPEEALISALFEIERVNND